MAYGSTITLPTITGTHTDFPVLLTELEFPATSIDGGANSIANGGGDLRIYTSSAKTTQLPIEVVSFVAGGTPSAEVWVKVPSVSTSATIYIEADDTETAQPAVTDTYGRNAVWSDYEAVLHLRETSGNGTAAEFLDSTGNGHDGQLTTGSSISGTTTNAPFGLSALDFNGTEAITLASSSSIADGAVSTIQAAHNLDGVTFRGLFGSRSNSPDTHWVQLDTSNRAFYKSASVEEQSYGTTFTSTTSYLSHLVFDGSASLINYRDGSQDAIDSSIDASNTSGITGTNNFRVGTYYDDASNRRANGRISNVRVRKDALTANWFATEYDNQSAATAWTTNDGWASQTTEVRRGGLGSSTLGAVPLAAAGVTTEEPEPSTFQPAWAIMANKLIGGF